jgi:soluble lytic murein transglycosylase-like protein
MDRKPVAARFVNKVACIGAALVLAQTASAAGLKASDDGALAKGLMRLGALMSHSPAADNASSQTTPAARFGANARCDDHPVAPEAVRKMVTDEALRQGVDVKLAIAIAGQESSFGERVNSPAAAAAGAMGVMQITAETARRYDVADPCDVGENVRGGVSFIRDLSARFGGNVFLVLAAYNAGEKRVYAAKGVPPISETVRYVAAAANAYYDFPSILSAPRREAHEPKNAPAAGAPAPHEDTVGQKWIGGSVLYVEQEK